MRDFGPEDRLRFHLEFAGDAKITFEKLQRRLEVKTMAEVVYKSIRLLIWYLDKREDGYEIALCKKDEPIRIVELDIL